jgi:hypothetical protein
MQDQPATSLSNNTTCKACNALVKSNAQAFCSNCGYPLQGTKAEQQQFIVYREVSQVDFNAHQKRMKQAGKVLFTIAGLTLFCVLLALVVINPKRISVQFAIAEGGVMAATFLGLGFWSRKKPMPALIIGLCLYLLLIIIDAIANPQSIIQFIFFKMIVIVYLIIGIRSSWATNKLIKEYKFVSE